MTVTSNIHVGLTAWSNHSFALGECCSNAGNAYRCITAGTQTAGSAPTGTGSSINNGGTAIFKWLSTAGASDYSTIAAWLTSIAGGTLSQPYIGLLWNDGAAAITTSAWTNITGHTTTATNNITLKCAPGESFTDSTANPLYFSSAYGVMMLRNPNYDGFFQIDDNFTVLDGIQFSYNRSMTHTNSAMNLRGSTTVSRCILEYYNSDQSNNGIITGLGASTHTLVNSVFINTQAAGQNSPATGGQDNSFTITNCIFYTVNASTNDVFHRNYSGTFTVTNTMMFGYAAVGTANLTAGVAKNNLTNLTTYGGVWTDTATLFSKTAANQFVNTASDFKLKTGADALNAGFTDTTHIPSATDVYGTSRPQGAAWDIGPHELVSAAAGYRARVVRWG